MVSKGKVIILLDNFVHDVTSFMELHPGGPRFLHYYNGKDASLAFNGKVYDHSNAGRNLRRKYLIGKLSNDNKSL